MKQDQEAFDRLMSKFKEAMDGEEDNIIMGTLMNTLIVKALNLCGNVPESYYTVSRLKHDYFTELQKALSEKKQSQ